MNVTKKFAGLFWKSGPGGPGASDGSDRSDGSDGGNGSDAAAVSDASVGHGATVGASNVLPFRAAPAATGAATAEASFAAIYASTPGDAKVDQILIAFESIRASMPASQLAIALGATVVALGADEAALVATLDARARALAVHVGDERRKLADRHAARSAELEATTAAVHAEIKTMESRIIALRKQLAAATESLEHKTSGERAGLVTLEERAQAEANRLQALREVLTPAARLARKR